MWIYKKNRNTFMTKNYDFDELLFACSCLAAAKTLPMALVSL